MSSFQRAMILVTTNCPLGCDHCCFSCNMNGEWMERGDFERIVKSLKINDTHFIQLTGGEPFLDIGRLKSYLDIARRYFNINNISLSTSAYWADSREDAYRILDSLDIKDIGRLIFSFDRFHLNKMDLDNIYNILWASKKLGIKNTLRPGFDKESYHLFEPLKKIMDSYDVEVVFMYLESFGRGENISPKIIKSVQEVTSDFYDYIGKGDWNKIKELGSPLKLTIYPNGNAYGCCNVPQIEFLGNILKDPYESLTSAYCRSLPGSLYEHGKDCSIISRLMPEGENNICEFCKDMPFNDERNTESISSRYIVLNGSKEIDSFRLEEKNDRTLLLSLRFTEQDLNTDTGKSITRLLDNLKDSGSRYKVSRPIPPCVLGPVYEKLIEEYDIPKGCNSCREFISFEDGYCRSCSHFGFSIPISDIKYLSRKSLMKLKEKRDLIQNSICKTCEYGRDDSCPAPCVRYRVSCSL